VPPPMAGLGCGGCRVVRHHNHVGTPGGHGPDMLMAWWNRPRVTERWIRPDRPGIQGR
jgi:hypothetical protein